MALKIEKVVHTIRISLLICILLSATIIYGLKYSIIRNLIEVDISIIIASLEMGTLARKFFMIFEKLQITYLLVDTLILFIVLFYPLSKLSSLIFSFLYEDNKEYTKKLRGADKWTIKQFIKAIKKDFGKKAIKGFLEIGDILFPKDYENESILMVGSPGSGKSVLLKSIISQITKRKNEKMIILDRAPEFINNFYNPNTDLIFFPKEENSIMWDFGNEINSREDVRFFVESLIHIAEDEKQPVFPLAAQLILESILLHLLDNNTLSNKGLIDFLRTYKTPETMKKALELTLDKYAINLDPFLESDSNFSGSIMGSLLVQFQKQFIIEDFYFQNRNFSIDDFLFNEEYQKVFIVNRKQESNLYNAYYVLFLSFLTRKILSLSNDTSRRIWLILDEFQTLKTANNRGLPAILSLLAEARKKGSSVIISTQSHARVEDLYKKTGMNSIYNTTNTKIFLRNQIPEEQKNITDYFGTVEQIEYSSSTSFAATIQQNDKTSMGRSIKEKKVILPTELSQLEIRNTKKGGKIFEGFIKVVHYPVTKFSYETRDYNTLYELKIKNIHRGFEPIRKPKIDVEHKESKKLDQTILDL